MTPPRRLWTALTSRLKIMAALDIAERRLPQDGRIKLRYHGREIDFRVSTLPTIFGEKTVLRILDREALQLDLAQLGFDPWSLDLLVQRQGVALGDEEGPAAVLVGEIELPAEFDGRLGPPRAPRRLFSHGVAAPERRELQKKLVELDREEHRLLDAYQAGLIELGQLERRQGLLRQRRTHVQASLETIRGEHATALQRADLERSVASFARSIAPTLAALAFADRQRLIRTVIERVMIEE